MPNWADEKWELDSLAVVACDGRGNGCVLWYGGGATLRYEIEEVGCRALDDLGLDDAPVGISVWVGRYVAEPCGVYEVDIETRPHGKFRRPHKSEWAKIKMVENPWGENG